MQNLPSLVLASQSPRRKQILESLGLEFRVLVKETEEKHPSVSDIDSVIQENSRQKALAVINTGLAPNAIVIGADTLVALNGEVLGKPRSVNEARAMLQKLSGQTQTVFTGLTTIMTNGKCEQSVVKSKVLFHSLTNSQIENYISTREPYDKAGAYAVQGLGALFIKEIVGSYTNVMGLPIEQLLIDLGKVSEIAPHLWFMKK